MAAAMYAAGDELVRINGNRLTKKEAVAHAAWNLILDGEIVFPDGRVIIIDDINQWLAAFKFIAQHLDGPPLTNADSRGLNAVVRVVYGDEPAFEDGPPVAGREYYNS